MKKSFLLSIVAVIAVAMTFSSCGKKSGNAGFEQEPLAGAEGVTILKAADGALGLQKGDKTITPTKDYKAFKAEAGFIIADYEDTSLSLSGQRLLDTDFGEAMSTMGGSKIIYNPAGYFETDGTIKTVYVPASKLRFAANAFAIVGGDAVVQYNGKINVYKDGKEILPPTDEFAKIILIKGTRDVIVQSAKSWGKGTINNGAITPGSALSAKDLKAFQARKGWNDSSPVMILE